MDGDQLLKEIERRAEFPDRHHAQVAAGAVLSTLGERLKGREPANLAAQLPAEFAEALPEQGSGEPFAIDEFDRRVAEREGGGCTPAQAHRHAHVVMTAVLGSVSGGERADVAAQLPADYTDMLP